MSQILVIEKDIYSSARQISLQEGNIAAQNSKLTKGIDFIMTKSGNLHKPGCIVCGMFPLDFKSWQWNWERERERDWFIAKIYMYLHFYVYCTCVNYAYFLILKIMKMQRYVINIYNFEVSWTWQINFVRNWCCHLMVIKGQFGSLQSWSFNPVFGLIYSTSFIHPLLLLKLVPFCKTFVFIEEYNYIAFMING